MLKKTILVALSVFSMAASADDFLVVHGLSYHFERGYGYQDSAGRYEQKWNEVNQGVGYEKASQFKDVSWIVGGYRNSYDKNSLYAGASWTPIKIFGAKLGLMGAVISGYEYPVAVMPVLVIDGERFGLQVNAVPKISTGSEKDGTGFVGASLRIRI